MPLKGLHRPPKRDDNTKALSVVVQRNEEIVDAKPVAVSSGTPRNVGSKEILARLHFF